MKFCLSCKEILESEAEIAAHELKDCSVCVKDMDKCVWISSDRADQYENFESVSKYCSACIESAGEKFEE